MAVGIGYDIHGLKRGCKLVLGGVEIPFSKGLVGHSDGDVLLHAVIDALLGAAGLGDIGEHFPNTDRRWKGVSSDLFAGEVLGKLKKSHWKIENIDVVVIAQAPHLSGHKKKICEKLAQLFKIKTAAVNIKAKTNEGFGAIGRGKAMAAYAVAMLRKK